MEQQGDFWEKAVAITFGLWSISIPIGVAMIRSWLREIQSVLDAQHAEHERFVLRTERQITLLMERQRNVMRRLGMDANVTINIDDQLGK